MFRKIMTVAVCAAVAMHVLGGGAAHAADDEPTTSRTAALIAADGSRIALPVSTSIVSDTVNGVTSWSISSVVDVPAEALGADPLDQLLNVDPGDVVSPDELQAPAPVDLLPTIDDPLAPVVGVELPEGEVSDADSIGGCQSDSTSTMAQSCLRMSYTSYVSNSKQYVKLLQYLHRWNRIDSQVRMYGALGRAGVNGDAAAGRRYHDAAVKKFGTPVSGTVYSHKPYWAGIDISVTGWARYQGANNEITLARGTRTWTLLHDSVYLGADPNFAT